MTNQTSGTIRIKTSYNKNPVYEYEFAINCNEAESNMHYTNREKKRLQDVEEYKNISEFVYNVLNTAENFYYEKLVNFAEKYNYGTKKKSDEEKITFYKNELNSINASCFTFEDNEIHRYGIDTVVPDFLSRLIYRKNLEFTPQQLVVVFQFFNSFPFQIVEKNKNGQKQREYRTDMSSYFDLGSKYSKFYDELIERTYKKDNQGFDKIEDYVTYVCHYFNCAPRMYPTKEEYQDFLDTFIFKKDVTVRDAIKILYGTLYDFPEEEERVRAINLWHPEEHFYLNNIIEVQQYLENNL